MQQVYVSTMKRLICSGSQLWADMDCVQLSAAAPYHHGCVSGPNTRPESVHNMSRSQTRGYKRKHAPNMQVLVATPACLLHLPAVGICKPLISSRLCSHLTSLVMQEASPLPSAFATSSAQSSGALPYANSCAALRSASMDSEASSYSPLSKRHCLYPCPPSDTPDAHSWQWHQQQQHASVPEQQPAAQPSHLSDAQKLYALKAMLQNSSSQQVNVVVAYLQQLQRLQHAATCQTHSAQAGHEQQSRENSTFVAQARKILKVRHQQARQQQLLHQHQHQHQHQQQQLLSRHSLQHAGAWEHRHGAADSFMHQLLDVQTPAQPQEAYPTTVKQCQPELTWQNSVLADSRSVPFMPAHTHHSHHTQHQLVQPELPQGFSTQSSAGHLLHIQQQARMLHQLAQAKRACMQQHIAQEQQAYAERQLAMSPTPSPDMGFAELVTYWAKSLSLQRGESVQLACHLWSRVQQQVSAPCFAMLICIPSWLSLLHASLIQHSECSICMSMYCCTLPW